MADHLRYTDEQQAAIDAAANRRTFVLDAPAGSGKSSTARGMCEAIDGRVLYLVYNRAAKDDAERTFPKANTTVRTTHSLGWRAFARDYKDRMNPKTARIPSWETARMAGITDVDLGTGFPINAASVASLATETIDRFCFTADVEITTGHIPSGKLPVNLSPLQKEHLKEVILRHARKIWVSAQNVNSPLKFSMDYAYKLYIMGDPQLGFDTIIVDEAQDSNGATEHLVKCQWNSQQIIIGDPAQQLYCQPLGTMVEIPKERDSRSYETVRVPIEDIKAGDLVVTYDNSHVYKKGRPVSHVTRFHYDGRLVRVTTATGQTSAYTDKHHCMVRIGDDLMKKYVVYLMRQGDKFRIGRTRFMYESQNWSFGLALRANAEKADAAWILSVHDTMAEASMAEALAQHQHNIPGVRFEPTHDRDEMDVKSFWQKYGTNLDAATSCLNSHGRLVEFPLWSRSNPKVIGVRRPFVTAAANLIDGMTMLPIESVVRRRGEDETPRRLWEKVTVTNEWYTGDVVSLEVADHHTYFADGLLTHNSWRGATDIMSRFGGDRLQLTQSFRFGEAVAEEATKWLDHTGTGITIKGLASLNSSVYDHFNPFTKAVLCRTNGGVMSEAIKQLELGKRVAVVGGVQELKNLAYDVGRLMAGKPVQSPELSAFQSWSELLTYTNEHGGSDLKPLVGLIQTHGTRRVIDACTRLVPERDGYPDVIISTGHKAKGREWDSIQVAEDFESSKPDLVENPLTGLNEPGPISRPDAMLHYVVTTRARNELSRGGLAWIDEYAGVVA